jgi:hypothetical protein
MDLRGGEMDVWLSRLSDEMESALEGIGSEPLEWAPAGKWNVAKILEHLSMAFSGTARTLEEALAKSAAKVRRPTARERIAIFVVTTVGYFPLGRKAPKFVVPTGKDGETALRQFRENLRRMDAALTSAERRWGKELIAVHPIIGPMTTHQWRRFHFVHTRHHAKQVRALRQNFAAKSMAA